MFVIGQDSTPCRRCGAGSGDEPTLAEQGNEGVKSAVLARLLIAIVDDRPFGGVEIERPYLDLETRFLLDRPDTDGLQPLNCVFDGFFRTSKWVGGHGFLLL
jgi:hypothetical protein